MFKALPAQSSVRQRDRPSRSPSLMSHPASITGSTQSFVDNEEAWRAKKQEEWKKQDRYRDKKLHVLEKQADIERKEQIRELARELRERNPDLSVQRSLIDASELFDTL